MKKNKTINILEISKLEDNYVKTFLFYLAKGSQIEYGGEVFKKLIKDSLHSNQYIFSQLKNDIKNFDNVKEFVDNRQKILIEKDEYHSNAVIFCMLGVNEKKIEEIKKLSTENEAQSIAIKLREIQNSLIYINGKLTSSAIRIEQVNSSFDFSRRYQPNNVLNGYINDLYIFWIGLSYCEYTGGTKLDLKLEADLEIISNYMNFIKFMFSLNWIMESPFYDKKFKKLIEKLYNQIQELMHNSLIVDFLIEYHPIKNSSTSVRGSQDRTTRLAIGFMLNNQNCYSLRIDFPHKGREYIHFNVSNQDGISGLPLNRELYKLFLSEISSADVSSLFYLYEDKYWFANDFHIKLDKIQVSSKDKLKIQNILDKQSHFEINSNIDDSLLVEYFYDLNIVLNNIMSNKSQSLNGFVDNTELIVRRTNFLINANLFLSNYPFLRISEHELSKLKVQIIKKYPLYHDIYDDHEEILLFDLHDIIIYLKDNLSRDFF